MSLPPGWAETTLGEIAETRLGKMLDAAKNVGAERPYLRNVNVRWGEFDLSDLQTMRVTEQEFDALRVRDGDIFACEGGEPGRCAVWREGPREIVYQKALHRIRPAEGIDPDFLAKRIEAAVRDGGVAHLLTGTTIKHLPQVCLQKIELQIPPAPEQRRIVAKLDALTARLARARAETRRIHELADKLRRGTLRQAFAGALTHSQSHADETGNTALPDGWTLQELGQFSDIQGGIQVGKKRPGTAPLIETSYLRAANVQRGWLKLDEIKTIGVTADERTRLLLQPGDILMNEGGDRDKLGRGWVWQGQVADCIHQNHVFRIRLLDQKFPPEFISHYANEFGQQYFIDEGTQTTNLASISKRKVAALPVPLPPADEARRIVKLITDAFARADRLEAEAKKALALIDRLEAAILTKAFRGTLVPQDPNDESASVLLKRIRACRAADPQPRRGRRIRSQVAAHA